MYHYKECGLDNVWLENGFTEKITPYGKAVAIDNAINLHQTIALDLTMKVGKLTTNEFRFMRAILGISEDGFAQCLGDTEQSVNLWERTENIPTYADSIARMLVSEKLKGNIKVSSVIERINTVERMCKQKIVAREDKHKWTSKIKIEPMFDGITACH